MIRNAYDVLGVTPTADTVVIHAAWKALLRKYHPDVNEADDAAVRTREINDAFAVIGNPDRRQDYDNARLRRPLARHTMPQASAGLRDGLRSRGYRPAMLGSHGRSGRPRFWWRGTIAAILCLVAVTTFDLVPNARAALIEAIGGSPFLDCWFQGADDLLLLLGASAAER